MELEQKQKQIMPLRVTVIFIVGDPNAPIGNETRLKGARLIYQTLPVIYNTWFHKIGN